MAVKKNTKQDRQGKQILALIKEIQEERKVQREIVLGGIQETLRRQLEKHFGTRFGEDVHVNVNPNSGILRAKRLKEDIDHDLLFKLVMDSKKDLMLTITGRQIVEMANQLQEQRRIPREMIISGIEDALRLAMQKHFGMFEEVETVIEIDSISGVITARHGEDEIDPELLGRIAAQSAKQLLIQKFREAESQATFDQYAAQKGDLVRGAVQRIDKGSAIVQMERARSEALLPRSEQIPGETLSESERVEAVILDVRKNGHRVKIVLSRTHPELVRRLFEREIPEIKDKIIEVKAVSREAGYRSKVAVSSIDVKVDCVGACVGVRGSRIKNIVDALGGNERIDIVRWNDSLQVLIPNALQPAQIEEVFLYPRLGRAIVMVQEDQLSLAIGRRGQNVRLASKLVGWDIEIMTIDELDEGITRAEGWFSNIPGVEPEMVEILLEEGFLSFDDLTFIENSEMAELIGVTEEEAEAIIEYAESAAEQVEEEARLRAEQEAAQGPKEEKSPALSAAEQLLGEDPKIEEPQSEPDREWDSLFKESNEQTVEELPDGTVVTEEASEEEAAEPVAEEDSDELVEESSSAVTDVVETEVEETPEAELEEIAEEQPETPEEEALAEEVDSTEDVEVEVEVAEMEDAPAEAEEASEPDVVVEEAETEKEKLPESEEEKE